MEYTEELHEQARIAMQSVYKHYVAKMPILREYSQECFDYMLDHILKYYDKYDPSKGEKFFTFAWLLAKNGIWKFIRIYNTKQAQFDRFKTISYDKELDGAEDMELVDLLGFTPDYDKDARYKVLLQACKTVLDNNKPGMRKFILPIIQGHSRPEVCKMYSVSRQAVESYVKRFAKLLKQELIKIEYFER